MIIIAPIYTKKSYNMEAVSKFIGQNYPDLKYYGSYDRKDNTSLRIYRYYKRTTGGQKKLYLLSPRLFSLEKESLCDIFLNCSADFQQRNSH